MKPLCVSAIVPTVPPTASNPTTRIAIISKTVRFRIALSFLLATLFSSCYESLHTCLLADRDLFQPGARLFVLSRADLTLRIPLPQRLQRLVVPRKSLARE